MTTATETSLRLTRLIAADPQTVFDAWTRPEHMRRWSCPEGARVEEVNVDLRVGGAYSIRMKGAEGDVHNAFGTYREIDPPHRLVYTWDWREADHAVGETVVTVEFHPRDDGTEVVIVQEGFPTPEAMAGHQQGWQSCLNRLEGLFA